jgi:pantothenate kinase type III
MIEKVLDLTLREMRADADRCRVFATGGLAPLFKAGLPRGVRLAPDLTLQGLRLAKARLTAREK